MRAHAKMDIHTFYWHGGRCREQCSDETASLCTNRLVDSLPLLDGLYCHRCVNTSATGTTYFWLNSNGIETGTHLCVTYERLEISLEDEQFVFEDGAVTSKTLSVYHWSIICSVTTMRNCSMKELTFLWHFLHKLGSTAGVTSEGQ